MSLASLAVPQLMNAAVLLCQARLILVRTVMPLRTQGKHGQTECKPCGGDDGHMTVILKHWAAVCRRPNRILLTSSLRPSRWAETRIIEPCWICFSAVLDGFDMFWYCKHYPLDPLELQSSQSASKYFKVYQSHQSTRFGMVRFTEGSAHTSRHFATSWCRPQYDLAGLPRPLWPYGPMMRCKKRSSNQNLVDKCWYCRLS
jgi:hypothetical protein